MASDERLRAARKLIQQGRYQVARDILRQVDDPLARRWLEQLEGLKPISRAPRQFNWRLPALVLGLSLAFIIMFFMLQLLPAIWGYYQNQATSASINMAAQDVKSERYFDLAHYCTIRSGYGGEYCLDWTDMVMAEYPEAANFCLNAFDVETPENHELLGECLDERGVPWLFAPPNEE